jgi:hypothetical protein
MLARALSSWGRLLGLGREPAPVEEERRGFGRVSCDVETTCRPAARGERQGAWTARVKNVSRSGVCLVVAGDPHVRPGELLSVSLPAAPVGEAGGEAPTEEVLACVVRCDPSSGDGWELGCTFAAPLSEQDLRQFGARRGARVPPEQRGRPRFRCQAQAVYQVVRSPEPTAGAPATVLNVSGGGVALAVAEPLAVGDLLSVELLRDGRAVLTALASVVRTTVEGDGGRVVGCNFIRELPEEQVAQLFA